MFLGNIAGTGSVIIYIPRETAREDTSIWTSNDKVHNNIATEATMHATKLFKLVLYNTEFFNNTATDNNAGISIEGEVSNFACFQCNFTENTAVSGGILNILSAININISSSIFKNNTVNFGEMIALRKSNKTMITDSCFENNKCSSSACHIFIDNAVQLFIDSCIFVSNQISQPVLNSYAISFYSKNIIITNIQIIGIAGSMLETISNNGWSQIKNITFSCPVGYAFLTEYTFINDLSENITAQGKTMETNTTKSKMSFLLKCEPCPINHYRIGLSSHTLMSPNSQNENKKDVCSKCPSGGICNGPDMVAEPNYWGFVHENQLVFVFCQINHCCQLSPCQSYDTCNEGRTGRMCTSCSNEYQLSLTGNNCMPTEECAQGLIYIVPIVTALAYVAFLLIKVEIISIILAVIRKLQGYLGKGPAKGAKQKKINTDLQHAYMTADQNLGVVRNYNLQSDNGEVMGISGQWKVPFDSVEIFHIIVFHLQDTNLFKITLPDMPDSPLSLKEYQSRIISVARLDALTFSDYILCLDKGSTDVTKLFIITLVVPLMLLIFVISFLLLKGANLKKAKHNRLMTTAMTVFLLIIMLSSQKMSTFAFDLVKCEWLGSGHYLRIDSTVKCHTFWQWVVFIYIILFILPFWLSLFIGPGLLHHQLISQRTFLFGLLFPGPFVLYSAWLPHRNKARRDVAFCHKMTTTSILNEVWYSFSYKYLCWGGVVELRRLALVICATLIATPIVRIVSMILITVMAYTVHFKFSPYSDSTANACANVSLFGTLAVGIINFGWATLLYSGRGFEYGNARKIGEVLLASEQFFIQGLVVGIISFCMGRLLVVNLIKR